MRGFAGFLLTLVIFAAILTVAWYVTGWIRG